MLETKTVTNGPIAMQLQHVCHGTLPWLISFSLGHGTTILSRSTMQPSTPTLQARCFSLLEFAVAVFIVLGHNVFHILPNEVPILFILGWISLRLRNGGWKYAGLSRPHS
jgi:hypothetical protein